MIYVDDPMEIGGKFHDWCHLFCDGDLEELHNFALKLGLWKTAFQNRTDFPHYDLSFRKRDLALRYGAEYLPLREWIARQRAKHLYNKTES